MGAKQRGKKHTLGKAHSINNSSTASITPFFQLSLSLNIEKDFIMSQLNSSTNQGALTIVSNTPHTVIC